MEQVTIGEVLTPEVAAGSLQGMLDSAYTVITSDQGIKGVFSIITGNALLQFYLGVGIVGICFRLFRKAKRAAH